MSFSEQPGMLYVTMQPHAGLPSEQFDEWYNNEHGPTRLRLPHVFGNGLRYRATDGQTPAFLAVYDVTALSHLATPAYTKLRAARSPREAATIAQVDVRRSFLELVFSRQADDFAAVETLPAAEAAGWVLVAVELTLKTDCKGGVGGAEEEVWRWYREEHLPLVMKVPGWRRTRLYRLSGEDTAKEARLFGIIEYNRTNGLGGPEFQAASAPTPWRQEVFSKYISGAVRRAYELYYVFAPGPRDLASLARLPDSAAFTSADSKIETKPGAAAAIRCFAVAHDGLEIPYKLEGNTDPAAPVVVLSNSLLTSLDMWNPTVSFIKWARPDLRILRYDTRGRHALPQPPVPATLEMLADDLATVLSAVRIARARAVIGVSMGGATTLKFALRHSDKLEKFVACDFNAASSDANTAAWKERIAVAEGPGEFGEPGIRKLAEQTVERWYHPQTMYEDGQKVAWMQELVAGNNVEGFKYSCQALWNYDMKEEMKDCRVPGLLVVGEGDGKGALVKAMDGFKAKLGKEGVELKIVPAAGHLPMCENPEGFWDAIKEFL